MAVSAVPGSLLGRIAADSGRIRAAFKARAAKSAVPKHLLTGVALILGDVAAWLHGMTPGLLATAGAALIFDWKLQG